MVDALEYEQFVHVNLRPTPRPEQIPIRPQILPMRQLLPPPSPQKTRRYNIIHLLPSLNNPIILCLLPLLICTILELTLNISIEYLYSLDKGFEVNVSGLGVLEELTGVGEVVGVAAVEGEEDGGAEGVFTALLEVDVGLKCLYHLPHYQRNILHRLPLSLSIEHIENMIESRIHL